MVDLSRIIQSSFSKLQQDKFQFELRLVVPRRHSYQYHGLEWVVQHGIYGRVVVLYIKRNFRWHYEVSSRHYSFTIKKENIKGQISSTTQTWDDCMRCYISPRVGPESTQPVITRQEPWWKRALVRNYNPPSKHFSISHIMILVHLIPHKKSGCPNSTTSSSGGTSLIPWGWGLAGDYNSDCDYHDTQLGWMRIYNDKICTQGVSFWIPTGEGRLGAWLLPPDDGSANSNDSNPGTNGRSSSKRNTILRTSSSHGCVYILYLHGISNHRSYSHRFLSFYYGLESKLLPLWFRVKLLIW